MTLWSAVLSRVLPGHKKSPGIIVVGDWCKYGCLLQKAFEHASAKMMIELHLDTKTVSLLYLL